MGRTHPGEAPASPNVCVSSPLISTSKCSRSLVLTTISSRISSSSEAGRRIGGGGGGFRLPAARRLLPPRISAGSATAAVANVAAVCFWADPGRDVVEEANDFGFAGVWAVARVCLFPLLFCPNRVARESVPIMMIPRISRVTMCWDRELVVLVESVW